MLFSNILFYELLKSFITDESSEATKLQDVKICIRKNEEVGEGRKREKLGWSQGYFTDWDNCPNLE